jgi:hypothetical protein
MLYVIYCLQDAVRGDHGEVVSLLLHHGGKVTNKEGHLIDLGDSNLSGNVRIFGEIDPEWELDPKQIVFEQKVRGYWIHMYVRYL